jgi:ADP-ribose pyrophosphatase YjhB (NUDIX family)
MADVPPERERVPDTQWQRLLLLAVQFRAWLMGGVFTAGALCLVFRDNGDILLVRPRYREGWGLPGGFMKHREQAESAIVRELQEEVGMIGAVVKPVAAYVQEHHRHIDHLFVAYVHDHQMPRPKSSLEIAETKWFPIDALPPLQPEADAALAVWAEQPRGTLSA